MEENFNISYTVVSFEFLNIWVINFVGPFAKTWWRKRFIRTFATTNTTNQRLSAPAQGQLLFISFNHFVFLGMLFHDIIKYFEIEDYIYIHICVEYVYIIHLILIFQMNRDKNHCDRRTFMCQFFIFFFECISLWYNHWNVQPQQTQTFIEYT